MRILGIEVVARSVEISGHGGQIASVELPVVGPAHLDAGDFGYSIGTVGGLERSGEEILFLDRLGAELGVDTTGTEEEQAVDAGAIAGIDHIGLNDQVFTNKVCGINIVGQNATDLGSGQKDVSGTLLLKEALHGDRVSEVELSTRSQQEP